MHFSQQQYKVIHCITKIHVHWTMYYCKTEELKNKNQFKMQTKEQSEPSSMAVRIFNFYMTHVIL